MWDGSKGANKVHYGYKFHITGDFCEVLGQGRWVLGGRGGGAFMRKRNYHRISGCCRSLIISFIQV